MRKADKFSIAGISGVLVLFFSLVDYGVGDLLNLIYVPIVNFWGSQFFLILICATGCFMFINAFRLKRLSGKQAAKAGTDLFQDLVESHELNEQKRRRVHHIQRQDGENIITYATPQELHAALQTSIDLTPVKQAQEVLIKSDIKNRKNVFVTQNKGAEPRVAVLIKPGVPNVKLLTPVKKQGTMRKSLKLKIMIMAVVVIGSIFIFTKLWGKKYVI